MSTSKDIEDSLRHTLNRDSHDISLPLSDDLHEQVDGGDANLDGSVTSGDITCVIQGIFALPCAMPDCNGDGRATSGDITCVTLAIFGPPPEPTPTPTGGPTPTPAPPPVENEQICDDFIDNDEDGLADCADSDCDQDVTCLPEQICDDGIDNDLNGVTDCDDIACIPDEACQETVSCEAVLATLCERVDECELDVTTEECIAAFVLLGFDCVDVEDSFSPLCILEIAELDCIDIGDPKLPDSCFQ